MPFVINKETDPYDICVRLGHSGEYGEMTCPVCGQPTQWVRVEIAEGKAYTYKAFEVPSLESGEFVRLPGNRVHATPFIGKVLRTIDGPDEGYAGPYKAVLGRVL